MTPAKNSAVKVGINFLAVVAAFWTGKLTYDGYTNWKAAKAAKQAGAQSEKK